MKEFIIKNIYKNIDNFNILNDISVSVDKGEILCVLGPSGCGKTTLLRIAAGLDAPDSGDVIFRGKSIVNIPSHKRNFGMMFQDFALFPHKNVFKNISFGLEMKKKGKKEIKAKVDQMLELVSLGGYAYRRVDELSGGERQRVALARTIAPSPALIMLDEPLGSLDKLLRERLLADLCLILNKTNITSIFVTHDQKEAFAVSNYICIMNSGKIEQTDMPEKLYNNPINKNVAEFLGFQNIIKGNIDKNGIIKTNAGSFLCSIKNTETNNIINLLILPDSAHFISENNYIKKNKNKISGIVSQIFFQGNIYKIAVKTNNNLFFFNMPAKNNMPRKNDKIFLSINSNGLRIIKS